MKLLLQFLFLVSLLTLFSCKKEYEVYKPQLTSGQYIGVKYSTYADLNTPAVITSYIDTINILVTTDSIDFNTNSSSSWYYIFERNTENKYSRYGRNSFEKYSFTNDFRKIIYSSYTANQGGQSWSVEFEGTKF